MSNFNLKLGSMVVVVLLCSFYVTTWLIDVPLSQEIAARQSAPVEATYQQFEGTTAAGLLIKAQADWKHRKYDEGFEKFVSVYQKSKPRTRERVIAALTLASAYHSGRGVKKDFDRAFFYSRVEDIKNHPWALYRAGMIMKDPGNAKRNADIARKFFTRASQLGLKPAATELAKLN